MADTTESSIALIDQAQEAVRRQAALTTKVEGKQTLVKRLEKSLEDEKKAIENSITTTVRKRRAEIADSFDEQIGVAQKEIRKVENAREKAKNTGVKDRVSRETAGLKAENKELEQQINTIYRANKVPSYCKSMLFNALHAPKTLKEFSLMLILGLICLFVIPVGVYVLFCEEKTIWLVLIYLADILVFGGMYELIGNRLKLVHRDALAEGRKLRSAIQNNEKRIRSLTKSIRNDQNEEMYDLGEFDRKLSELNRELADLEYNKRHALDTFDGEGARRITDEIRDNNKERIDSLEAKRGEETVNLEDAKRALREETLLIAKNFEPVLGREYMDPEKLEQLKRFFTEGKAKNISEALEISKLAAGTAEN